MADKRVRIIYEAIDNASQVGRKVQDEAKKTKSTLDNLKRDADKLAGALSGGIAGALGVAGIAMLGKQVAGLTWEIAKQGIELERLERNYRRLGNVGWKGIQELRQATKHMVTDQQLMQSASQYMAMNLADTNEEAGKLIGTFARLAEMMGRPIDAAIGEGAQLLANQSTMRLDQFGLSAARVEARVKALMAADKDLSKEAAFTNAVMAEAAEVLARVGNQADSGAEALAQMQTAWTNMLGEVGRAAGASDVIQWISKGFVEQVNVSQVVGDWTRELNALRDSGALSAQAFTAAMTEANKMGMAYQSGAVSAEEYTQALERLMPTADRLPMILQDGTEAMTAHEAQVRRMAARYVELEQAIWGVGGAMNQAAVSKGYYALDPWLETIKGGSLTMQHYENADVIAFEKWEKQQKERERLAEQASLRAQAAAERHAMELRSLVEGVLQPTQVTDLDMARTNLGTYTDQWDEYIRRIRSAATDANSAWKHLIPTDILAQGGDALKVWAAETEEAFYAGQMPEMVNWDAVMADIQRKVQEKAGREALVDEAVRRAQAAGIGISRGDVAAALGVQDLVGTGQNAAQQMAQGVQQVNIAATLTAAFEEQLNKQGDQWRNFGVLTVSLMAEGAKAGAGLFARDLAMAVYPFLARFFVGQGARP